MFKVNNKNTRMTSLMSFGVSIVNFEQVNAGWEISKTWWTEVFKCDSLGNNTSSINLNWCKFF